MYKLTLCNHVTFYVNSVHCEWQCIKPSNHSDDKKPRVVSLLSAEIRKKLCHSFARKGRCQTCLSWGQNPVHPQIKPSMKGEKCHNNNNERQTRITVIKIITDSSFLQSPYHQNQHHNQHHSICFKYFTNISNRNFLLTISWRTLNIAH